MGVSIRPSEMTEGGAVPFNRNLRWTQCGFNLFTYVDKAGKKGATTTALRVVYVDDDGEEYDQQYSASDPTRFLPTPDGKTVLPVGMTAEEYEALPEDKRPQLSKSSNFYLLMSNLVSAGYDESKLEDDVTSLNGLYTYNIAIPQPKRAGLSGQEVKEGGRERTLSVPSTILQLPGEKPKAGAKGAAKKTAAAPAAEADVTAETLAFVAKTVAAAGDDGITRQAIAVAAFAELKDDPNLNGVVNTLFQPVFAAALLANGFTLDGETVSKA